MPGANAECPVCARPIPDSSLAKLCAVCITEVSDLLDQLPHLIADTNLAITKQTAMGERSDHRAKNPDDAVVLTWNEHASNVRGDCLARLASWAQSSIPGLETLRAQQLERRDHAIAREPAPDLVAAVTAAVRVNHLDTQIAYLTGGRWVINADPDRLIDILRRAMHALVRRADAAQFHADLIKTRAQLLAAVDRPPSRVYVGTCLHPRDPGPCVEELYAVDHRDHGRGHTCEKCAYVTCPSCRTRHDVAQRRTWLAEALEDRLATASDIARGTAGTLGLSVTKDQIDGWRHRGRLLDRGHDTNDHLLYRIGDVLDLANEATHRAAQPKKKPRRSTA